MNLGERLWLCAIPQDGVIVSPKVPVALGGAIVAELVLAGRLHVEEDGVSLLDSGPTGDELLDEALAAADDTDAVHNTKATWFVSNIGVLAMPKMERRMVAAGAVIKQAGGKRRFWLDRPDWYELTAAGEEPRRHLRALLLGEVQPDASDAILAGLADAADLIRLHVPSERRDEAKARAETLAAGTGLPEHVRKAIEGAQAATAGAVIAAQNFG